MELHEFQGARSLPNVVLIKHLFLNITNSNLTYLNSTNSFFLAHFMEEKRPSRSHGTETNHSEHKMKCFLMDSPLWSQDVIDNMIGYINLCTPNDDCLERWKEMFSKGDKPFVENSVQHKKLNDSLTCTKFMNSINYSGRALFSLIIKLCWIWYWDT